MIIEKLILGVTLAAPLGPVSIEMIKRGLNKGFWQAFVVRLGGAVGNSLCLIGSYYGLAYLLDTDLKKGICGIVGSLVLIYMGLKTVFIKSAYRPNEENMASSLFNGLSTGFVLSIANPIGILFWIGIFAASIDRSAGDVISLAGLGQNFAIILGVLLWGLFLSGLLEVGKRFINEKMIRYITIGAGILLIYFGIKYALKAYATLV